MGVGYHDPVRQKLLLASLVVALAAVVFVERDRLAAFTAAELTIAAAHATGSSPRVDAAKKRLREALPKLFLDHGVAWPPAAVFLRAIKENDDGSPGVVELWARDKKSTQLTLIKSYPICALSGALGPKRKQGDLQIPEGFYTISKLNPGSSYHLSMRVDYPNASDKIRGRAVARAAGVTDVDLGGDIMVHGNCVTIGCIPLQDEPIEEVYLVADAVFGKRRLPIHIFPRRLDDAGLERLLATTTDPALQGFWRELAAGWQAFEKTKTVPVIAVAKDGAYVVER
jgi:hypothetical protein